MKRVKKLNNKYIDIHSHVLWGLDDGAGTLGESVELCEIAAQSGTSHLFLTPHLMYWESAEELFDERNMKFDRLEEIIAEENIGLKLCKGFEILCDDDIFNIKYFNPYTLNDTRYILIEFDFFKTSLDDVVSWTEYLKSYGLVPIIAHPERYEFLLFDRKGVDLLSEKGNLFQLNSGSAAGMFGEEVQNFAEEMIKYGYADFIGSDAHDLRMRNTDIDFCFDNYSDEINLEFLEKACITNPLKLLQDEQIKPCRLCYFAKN